MFHQNKWNNEKALTEEEGITKFKYKSLIEFEFSILVLQVISSMTYSRVTTLSYCYIFPFQATVTFFPVLR